MNVDQIVWQVEACQCPERFVLLKGVVIVIGPTINLTKAVLPMVKYYPDHVKQLAKCYQPLHEWFATRGRAIEAAKATCRSKAILGQVELENKLFDSLVLLNDLKE
jgi:hypothetical protein